MDYLRKQGSLKSLKTADDAEIATTITNMGDDTY
jgi:hypothetical protein